jgi:hypothetical protein
MNNIIDLSRFQKYSTTRIQELTHPGSIQAFSQIDWSKYSEEIYHSLIEFYASLKEECDRSGPDNPVAVVDFRWDDAGSETGVLADYDCASSLSSAFSYGPTDPRILIDFSDFITHEIGEEPGTFRDALGDDYDILVQLFSKFTIEVILQTAGIPDFAALAETIQVIMAYTYFHDETAALFYKSSEPHISLFDENGAERTLYPTLEDRLNRAFEDGDIDEIIKVVPKAISGSLALESLVKISHYILAFIKSPGSDNTNVFRLLQALEPVAGTLMIFKKDYESILVNALCVHNSSSGYINFIEKKLLPEPMEDPTLALNLSCAFSVLNDKVTMLKYMTLALELGKDRESFETDSDFDRFRKDEDFISTLNTISISSETLSKELPGLVDMGKFDEAKELIERGADINVETDDLYGTVAAGCISSSKKGKLEFLRYAIEKGLVLKVDDLRRAISNKNCEIISLILESIKIEELSETEKCRILETLSDDGDSAVLELLVKNGFDVTITSKIGDTALHFCRHNRDMAFIDRLLELGVDPKSASEYGTTPLHSAASADNTGLIRKLAEAGADVNAVDNQGNLPLNDAFFNDNEKAAACFLELGINTGIKDNQGKSVLHQCVESGAKSCFPLLIDSGIDLNSQDNQGQTALHIAAEYGLVQMMKMLLEAGADKEIRDRDNNRALDLAEKKQVKMLLE